MLIEEKLRRQEEREEFFNEWQEKMRGEIEEKEEKLRVFANELISQHNEVKEKLAKLEAETEMMKQQEEALKEKMDRSAKELEAKKSEMELEKADIETAYERLLLFRNKELEEQRVEKEKTEEKKKQDAATQLEGMNLLKWLQDQCSGLLQGGAHAPSNHVEKQDKGLQTVLPTPETQKNMDMQQQRDDDEKEELRERVMRQRRRIDELTTRAADLTNQLQDAQQLHLITTPPIAAQPTVRLHPRPAWPPHTGSGEETSFSERLPNSVSRSTQASRMTANTAPLACTTLPPSDANNTSAAGNCLRRRTRRLASRSPVPPNNNSSDESTTTEEMIEEARQRLRRLENESSEIHQTYQDFRVRLSQDIPPTLFHPEQDRSRNPFNYRNFSNAGQSMIVAGRNMLARTNPRTSTVKLDNMLSIRPTYDMFQPRYNSFQNSIVGSSGRNFSVLRQRPLDNERILNSDGYSENGYQTFSRQNRSRDAELNTLRKKVAERRIRNSLSPEEFETVLEKSDNGSTQGTAEEQKETSGMESEGVMESMRNHEMLCSEIDEKLSKRKEFLKKTGSGSDSKSREEPESFEKKRTKLLTFNRTVTVVENNKESWYAAKDNSSEDDDSSGRSSLRGPTRLNAIPEQTQSGNSNCSFLGRSSDKLSTQLPSRISEENATIVKVNGDALDTRGMTSSELGSSEQIIGINNYGNVEEEELNHNSYISLTNNRLTKESKDPKPVSGSVDSLLDERSRIRLQNGLVSSHPRQRSPSSLVSHASTNGSLSPTAANLRSPKKFVASDLSDRVPSFVLSPRKNGANPTTNQDDSGEPDVLITDLEKTTITNSVGGGEVNVESSKLQNGSKFSAANAVQSRVTVTSPRIAAAESVGDPWREPGDGTDNEKLDSDDPVSVGTHDSSSANSFW
ncbi:uncharacterized protein LOC111058759 isoform X2 [Nilaparvata lugens]|uniref:uncharacterized protein LOC111058759 isoform X2 n=1 Tax=Nilaparvata lugens TaxID=108931 RepID=UPI00193C9201|nr:uncharacterized protein LOC111058759 isoform X2 [Nilaparvata lugens]